MKIIKKSSRFFVKEGLLFIIGFNQAPLRRIVGYEVARVLKEVHQEIVTSIKGIPNFISKSSSRLLLAYHGSRCYILCM